MDTSIISALAALTGAAVGGLTSGIANWLNHRSQVRAQWILHEKTRRQLLYRDFIEEASKCYIDALQHDEADIPGLVGLYAKLSRMRTLSSKSVVHCAEDVARKILDSPSRCHRPEPPEARKADPDPCAPARLGVPCAGRICMLPQR